MKRLGNHQGRERPGRGHESTAPELQTDIKFEVITAVNIDIADFLGVTTCSLVYNGQLSAPSIIMVRYCALETAETDYFETLVTFHQTTRNRAQEDLSISTERDVRGN
jgi:hypothetical protein